MTAALQGLSASERAELLGLLQAREAQEAARPVDDRPSLAEIFPDRTAEFAAASVDPERYLAADAAHRASYEAHAARLQALRPEPPVEDVMAAMEWFRGICDDAEAAAEADGHPQAWKIVPQAKSPASEPNRDIDELVATKRVATRRSNTPRGGDLLLDDVIGETEDRERLAAAERADRAAAAEEAQEAKLAPYRDKSPTGMPPSWPDS